MAGENYGVEETQVTQAPEDGNQQAQEDVQAEGTGCQSAVKGGDSRIAELKAQVAEAVKTAEADEALRGEIAELKTQGEEQRVEFELRLAGVCNVKVAKAILSDHGSDVAVPREAKPWLFFDTIGKQQSGKTGLPNAGTSSDEGKTMRRWRRIAGLDDTDEE